MKIGLLLFSILMPINMFAGPQDPMDVAAYARSVWGGAISGHLPKTAEIIPRISDELKRLTSVPKVDRGTWFAVNLLITMGYHFAYIEGKNWEKLVELQKNFNAITNTKKSVLPDEIIERIETTNIKYLSNFQDPRIQEVIWKATLNLDVFRNRSLSAHNAWKHLGNSYRNQGLPKMAFESYQKAMKIPGLSKSVLLKDQILLISAMGSFGAVDLALDQTNQALSDRDSKQSYVQYDWLEANNMILKEEYKSCAKKLKEKIPKKVSSEDIEELFWVHNFYLICQMRSGDLVGAKSSFDFLQSHPLKAGSPSWHKVHETLIEYGLRSKNYDSAKSLALELAKSKHSFDKYSFLRDLYIYYLLISRNSEPFQTEIYKLYSTENQNLKEMSLRSSNMKILFDIVNPALIQGVKLNLASHQKSTKWNKNTLEFIVLNLIQQQPR